MKNAKSSRTSDDIDMKLGPAAKFGKRNKATLKQSDDNVIPENCDVIPAFPIYDRFGAIWEPDFGRTVCRTSFY